MRTLLNGVDVHGDNTCSSHLPILLELFTVFKPAVVLEYGSGNYSTKFFLDYARRLHSVEITSRPWYEHIKNRLQPDQCWWDYRFIDHPERVEQYAHECYAQHGPFDVLFVDAGDYRARLANFSFFLGDIVVVHDAQKHWRNDIFVPAGYRELNFKQFPVIYPHPDPEAYENRPWTTLYTRRDDVHDHFTRVEETSLYEKYKFPYIYSEPPAKAQLAPQGAS